MGLFVLFSVYLYIVTTGNDGFHCAFLYFYIR